MKRSLTFRMHAISLVLAFILLGPFAPAAAAQPAQDSSSLESLLMPIVGNALVEAGEHHWADALADIRKFEALWKENGLDDSGSGKPEQVTPAIHTAIEALQAAEDDPLRAYQTVSDLAKAFNRYISGQKTEEIESSGKKAAEQLLPMLNRSLDDVQKQDIAKTLEDYRLIVELWPRIESSVRTESFGVYSEFEIQMSLIRIAVQAEPPHWDQAEQEIRKGIQVLNDFIVGKTPNAPQASGKQTVADLLKTLRNVTASIQSERAAQAAEQMQKFIKAWPAVEGEVRIRSAETYTSIENEMAEAAGYLVSDPPKLDMASRVVAQMTSELEPLITEARYTAWDAALILLREGLEALLVLAALLAFLRRTGNHARQKWIWTGAGAGLLASLALAVVFSYALSQAATGSTRELMEGITGLVAVVMMMTVGVWLHGKSHMKVWSEYIQRRMGMAIARGSLWSLFAVAFLAILREGAETAIFYLGMAGSIGMLQLLLGIGSALLLLLVLGFAIIRFSARLPVRAFFLVAAALIYYLVVKFVGESIHALQVAGYASAHAANGIPSFAWIGMYPTWETFLLQLLAVVCIVLQIVWVEWRRKAKPRFSFSE